MQAEDPIQSSSSMTEESFSSTYSPNGDTDISCVSPALMGKKKIIFTDHDVFFFFFSVTQKAALFRTTTIHSLLKGQKTKYTFSSVFAFFGNQTGPWCCYSTMFYFLRNMNYICKVHLVLSCGPVPVSNGFVCPCKWCWILHSLRAWAQTSLENEEALFRSRALAHSLVQIVPIDGCFSLDIPKNTTLLQISRNNVFRHNKTAT